MKKKINLVLCGLLTLLIFSCSSEEDSITQTDLKLISERSGYADCGCPDVIADNASIAMYEPYVEVGSFAYPTLELAVAEIKASGGGSLFFPPIEHVISVDGSSTTLLNFTAADGIDGLEIYGVEGTVLLLDVDGDVEKPAKLMKIWGVQDLHIHDLHLKGEFTYDPLTSAAGDGVAQMNLQVRNSSNVNVYNVKSTNVYGDGMNFGATSGQITQDVFIYNVCFNNINRGGLVMGGKGEMVDVEIANSFFGKSMRKQQIDFEPLVGSLIHDVSIHDNFFEELVTSETSFDEQFAIAMNTREGLGMEAITIEFNEIQNGLKFAKGVNNLLFASNNLGLGSVGIPHMTIANNAENILVDSNFFQLENRRTYPDTALEGQTGIVIREGKFGSGPFTPNDIEFLQNQIEIKNSASNLISSAFLVEGATQFKAHGNIIEFKDVDATNTGFRLVEDSSGPLSIEACYNSFININSLSPFGARNFVKETLGICIDDCSTLTVTECL